MSRRLPLLFHLKKRNSFCFRTSLFTEQQTMAQSRNRVILNLMYHREKLTEVIQAIQFATKKGLQLLIQPTNVSVYLMFTGPCIVIYSYSKTNKMHLFLKLFILVKHSICFGRSFHPSSGAQDCTYSNRHMSNSCCYPLLAVIPSRSR
jgi:hypothetical protein